MWASIRAASGSGLMLILNQAAGQTREPNRSRSLLRPTRLHWELPSLCCHFATLAQFCNLNLLSSLMIPGLLSRYQLAPYLAGVSGFHKASWGPRWKQGSACMLDCRPCGSLGLIRTGKTDVLPSRTCRGRCRAVSSAR